jgi:hypothetical protein
MGEAKKRIKWKFERPRLLGYNTAILMCIFNFAK